MIGDEFALGYGIVGARLPGRREFRLVLHRDGVKVNAVIGICDYVSRTIESIRIE